MKSGKIRRRHPGFSGLEVVLCATTILCLIVSSCYMGFDSKRNEMSALSDMASATPAQHADARAVGFLPYCIDEDNRVRVRDPRCAELVRYIREQADLAEAGL